MFRGARCAKTHDELRDGDNGRAGVEHARGRERCDEADDYPDRTGRRRVPRPGRHGPLHVRGRDHLRDLGAHGLHRHHEHRGARKLHRQGPVIGAGSYSATSAGDPNTLAATSTAPI